MNVDRIWLKTRICFDTGETRTVIQPEVRQQYAHRCWHWWGRFSGQNRNVPAVEKGSVRRLLWIALLSRPIAPDQIVDTLCENFDCVNPQHFKLSRRGRKKRNV